MRKWKFGNFSLMHTWHYYMYSKCKAILPSVLTLLNEGGHCVDNISFHANTWQKFFPDVHGNTRLGIASQVISSNLPISFAPSNNGRIFWLCREHSHF